MKLFLSLLLLTITGTSYSQGYWQQQADYTMDIDFNHETHQFKGEQKIVYTNNSPDALDKVYYHLYFNAFQPGSMMDVRSQTIIDPDKRVGDRISKLKPNEEGFQKINSLSMNGKPTDYKVVGTILEVNLPEAIQPGQTVTFEMDFLAQVPLQIRRSGRHSAEGIDYSMTQWYPKLSEYDHEGWHANPYVGREFHGVWGNFDVTIHIDKKYTIGGTGILQNPEEIGKGYEASSVQQKVNNDGKLSWHFIAKKVHDFAWAADPDYKHDIMKLENGTKIHFFYQTDTNTVNWEKAQPLTVAAFEFLNKKYGEYPYAQYTIIQGGDGGMEYPMATLITGHRSLASLVGVIVHEAVHSWYQGVIATNEAKYPWMDEGFTCYAQNDALDHIYEKNALNPHLRSHRAYHFLVSKKEQEPLTTHADHYKRNRTYGISVYSKGEVFLDQLNYIVGEELFNKIMLQYFEQWKFKHPTDKDFKRLAERVSGLELDWYLEQFIATINHIDYGIESIEKNDSKTTTIKLVKNADMPMPLDVAIKLKDGTIKVYNIPLTIMRGAKQNAKYKDYTVVEADWPWTNPEYTLLVDVKKKDIEYVEIDPSLRLSDVDRTDNIFPRVEKKEK